MKKKSKEFEALKKSYGLESPEQIKLAIIFHHLKELTRATFGASPGTEATLRKYERHWKICEREE